MARECKGPAIHGHKGLECAITAHQTMVDYRNTRGFGIVKTSINPYNCHSSDLPEIS
jgi:hypothetical protein